MKMQDRYEVKKASGKSIKVSVPGSKSITNRALLIAALAQGKSLLRGVLFRMTADIFAVPYLFGISSRGG